MRKRPYMLGRKIISLLLTLAALITTVGMTAVTSFAEEGAITEAAGHLESAYAEWTPIDGAEGYYAYISDGSDGWVRLDDQLIRRYKSFWRVDAVGLAAGSYRIKIVPVASGGVDESRALVTDSLSVISHDRSGFAFVNGSSSGAYNDDGTLKSGAVVVYVTDKNKNSVTATIDGTTYTGISNIIAQSVVKKTSTPIAVRFIGNITDPEEGEAFDKGDLLISYGKNITLEGIGEDATLNGFGIRIKRSSGIEIRNLGFMNCDSGEGDNVGLQQDNDHIWVHNCDFFYGDAGSDADQAKGDGALDTKTSAYITHSYNHFWDCGKVNLQGMKDESEENYATYHHNWYDHSDSRHPRVRTCTTHVYNNFYDGVSKYGIGATTGCSIFSEANYFLNTKNPMLSSRQGTDALGDGTFSGENGGIIKSFGDVFDNSTLPISYANNKTSFDAYFATSREDKLPSTVTALSGGSKYNNFDTDPSVMYDYEVQTAEEAMNTVKKYAGRMGGGDFKWQFSTADNTDYSVNQGLKAALVGYKTSVVSIGGINGVATGSDGNGSTGGSSVGAGGGSAGGNIQNPDTGNGGSEGGSDTGSGEISYDAVIHNFTDDGKTSDFFKINGTLSTGKGTVSYNGLTLTRCLKMESSTSISFTAKSDGMLLLVFVEETPNAKIDGEKTVGSDGMIRVELSAGAHTVTKGDTMNLFYMVFTPEQPESHEHSFVDGKCECGETDPNYVPPHEHSFVDGKCECGETDPNYVPPHEHSFVDGKCECGETDPNYVPPHEHSFVDGRCECGETDPDYIPPHEHIFVNGKCECGETDPDYSTPQDPDPIPDDKDPGMNCSPPSIWERIAAIFKAIADFFARLFGIKQ